MATLRVTTPFALLGLAILLAGCAADGSADKPRYFSEGTSTIDATVEAIDYASRTVTLTEDDGHSASFHADESVKNFDKLKVGDRVKAASYASVEVQVRDPKTAGNEAAPGVSAAQKPPRDGTFGSKTTVTAVVKHVDKKAGTVVLQGPEGNEREFHVWRGSRLQNVKVGDHVVATYTQSLAVAISPVDR